MEQGKRSNNLGTWKFLSWFLGVQFVLFALELLNPVRDAVVIPVTEWVANFSTYLMHLFDADVVNTGVMIQNRINGFSILIDSGCNGIEPIIVYFAAIVAFPATIGAKCYGILAGSLTIQILNILRVITLFYLGQWNQAAFNWAHLYLWQALIILDALVVWLIWLRVATRPRLHAVQ